jgi:50S ribosomal protein L16 3-hydroxylase
MNLKMTLAALLLAPLALTACKKNEAPEPKYPENIPEAEEIGTGDLEGILDQGYQLILEPASRLLYTHDEDEFLFWANGQGLCISEQFAPLLKNLADGEALLLDESLYDADILEDIAMLMNESVLMLLPPDEA